MKRALPLFLSATIWLSPKAGAIDAPANSPGPILTALEMRAPKENTYPDATPAFHQEVVQLVDSNTLESGSDFYRAATMANSPIPEYRAARMHHELMLVAAAKGSREAEKELMDSWDSLLTTLGRPLRFDPFQVTLNHPESDLSLDATPAAIQLVFRAPADAREAAAKATDNAELQKIVDADQEIRNHFDKLSDADRQNMMTEDLKRNARARAIITDGALHTAKDFMNASLVMQHSPRFAGFELAHELAICSMLLGDQGMGRWLVAATYDRMLNSAGHDQRFGTQGALTMGHQKPTLRETDEAGICDAERLALGCTTLAAKRANFFARPPGK